ncbi:TetR/AcrR family transcriptional regulator [Spirillospora sp. NPDC048911]|uniref:TetR/AcrR family transcriptional regulator n=1 Tax=Spirillospora sp. NPDC048911 TaxID=3364527 RepID=UPI003711032F
MPPQNTERRQAMADAAIDVLGEVGVHGLSHRAVDERAGLPVGTASNYFRSRDALLAAAAERVAELHGAETFVGKDLVEVVGRALFTAVTQHRRRWLAICELTLESTRRPALRETLTRVNEVSIQGLVLPFGNAVFGLLTGPPERITKETVFACAKAMVNGAQA